MKSLISVKGLKKHYRVRGRLIRALNGIDLDIAPGEVYGLVGESGCGKSTAARNLLLLERPTAGTIHFADDDLLHLSSAKLKHLRQQMQIVFQDPYASLNPRMTVLDIVAEGLDIHRLARGPERTDRVADLLTSVGLNPDAMHRYPHEFSGGQRQRIGIARALAPKPAFIVLDEPISALDLSVQAQVVNLLKELQAQMNLTYLFISHDLPMVRHMADRVGVMKRGRIIEEGPADQLFTDPEHRYTQKLLSAVLHPSRASVSDSSSVTAASPEN